MGRFRRVNITVPVELLEQLPDGLVISHVCTEALAARVACDHRRLRCAACGLEHDRHELVATALREFFLAVMRALDDPIRKVRTAETAARVVVDVAERHAIEGAASFPVPRPSKRERAWAAAEIVHEIERDREPARPPVRRPRAGMGRRTGTTKEAEAA
jgi:hypothetical protein